MFWVFCFVDEPILLVFILRICKFTVLMTGFGDVAVEFYLVFLLTL